MSAPCTDRRGSRPAPLLRLVRSRTIQRLWSLSLLAAAAYLLYRQVSTMSLPGFMQALTGAAPGAVLASMLLTAGSYLCLSGTEWLALRALGHVFAFRQAARVAIPAYALTNSAGFSPATGTALRIQLYRQQGLSPGQAAAVAMLAGAAVTLSGVTCAGLAMALDPFLFSRALHQTEIYVELAGLVLLAPAALWFIAFRPGAPRWLGGGEGRPLRPRDRRLGLAAGLGDWLLSSAALFVLLPHPLLSVFPSFFVPYVAGCLLSAAAGVPGGIGVFEAIVLLLAGLFAQVHETAAALLLYRAIYSLGPLALVGVYTGARRLGRRSRK